MPASYNLQLVFTIAVVISIVIQAGVSLGLYFAVTTALKKIMKITEDVTAKAMPIVGNVREVVQDLTPKIRTVSGHIVDISSTVRDQTQHVTSTVDDVVDKTRVQASKVDEMVSAVLGSLSHAGSTVQAGVAKPVRKVGSVLHGLRAGLDVLLSKKDAAATYAATASEPVPVVADPLRSAQTIHPPPTTSSPL